LTGNFYLASDAKSKLTIFPAVDDPPQTARFKAALRLVAGFTTVLTGAKECQRADIWEHFQRRNGHTFGQIFRSIQAGGGFQGEYKTLVEAHATHMAKENLRQGCDGFVREVENGSWDLYKAPRFKADYNLFMNSK
jgi:hypothetical protein